TWTDPTGRVRTTDPVDHRPLTLPDNGTDKIDPPNAPALVVPDGPHSVLEHCLEHRGGADWSRTTCRIEVHRPPPGRVPVDVSGHHRPRRPTPRSSPGDPPF
ncbi:hypothetical protein, partial [Phycicoccus sp.]|uniref:hypothetical protein n=1 Tax=Phycicoccus sp. TaxID=1902410 RepID=UPI002BB22E59